MACGSVSETFPLDGETWTVEVQVSSEEVELVVA